MLRNLTTEARNPASMEIDRLSAIEIVRLMNAEDAGVAPAVGCEAEPIARAIEVIADRLRNGGRLVYIGAGTSGRLGVLDASECPPTFSTRPEQVVGLIAGGHAALTRAIEGAEDHPELAAADLQQIQFCDRDVLVGIATSGRTPYVVGGLQYARSVGAFMIGLSCNRDSQLADNADLLITPVVGPEVISGSTRLKAGTATKLVLNMLTTGAMVLLGKTYGNLMVDLRATNQKLTDRSRRIVAMLTDLSEERAGELLARCGGEVKAAIVAHRRSVSPEEARDLLQQAGGHLRPALEEIDLKDIDRGTSPGSELVGAGDPTFEFRGSSPLTPRVETDSRSESTLIGLEGGGTKTIVWIATSSPTGEMQVLGRGVAGQANYQAIGFEQATANMQAALQAAWRDAGLPPRDAAAACLALAGADRPADRQRLGEWAEHIGLAHDIRIVNDAEPVLAAGTPEGWGVALISGTGSFAFGRNREGRTARSGGWGYLLGDEGSGYALALAGLQAAARAADGRGPATALLERLMARLELTSAEQLIPAVYQTGRDRRWIASLADVVTGAAEDGDPVARDLVAAAAADLSELVAATVRKLDLGSPVPLALTGGLLLNSPLLRELVERKLSVGDIAIAPITAVSEPVRGALQIASTLAAR